MWWSININIASSHGKFHEDDIIVLLLAPSSLIYVPNKDQGTLYIYIYIHILYEMQNGMKLRTHLL